MSYTNYNMYLVGKKNKNLFNNDKNMFKQKNSKANNVVKRAKNQRIVRRGN